jgi:uncharacterized protein
MRRIPGILIATAIGLIFGSCVVTDNAVRRPPHEPLHTSAAEAVARNTGADWEAAQVTAADGAVLKAWLFTPLKPNGSAVTLLHGVGDTRIGMLSHATFLLRNGFTVLVPDIRGHGESGGQIVTYGVKEAEDLRAWLDWLLRGHGIERLYGLGQSMGAAILLESLRTEHRFRAVVADSPFATFEEISYDRLGQVSGMPEQLFWPMVHAGFVYARVRFGVDLRNASPEEAIRHTSTPVLLIHGAQDTSIPPRHSEELHAANPAMAQLWLVPGAEHVASLSVEHDLYVRKVINWFNAH